MLSLFGFSHPFSFRKRRGINICHLPLAPQSPLPPGRRCRLRLKHPLISTSSSHGSAPPVPGLAFVPWLCHECPVPGGHNLPPPPGKSGSPPGSTTVLGQAEQGERGFVLHLASPPLAGDFYSGASWICAAEGEEEQVGMGFDPSLRSRKMCPAHNLQNSLCPQNTPPNHGRTLSMALNTPKILGLASPCSCQLRGASSPKHSAPGRGTSSPHGCQALPSLILHSSFTGLQPFPHPSSPVG